MTYVPFLLPILNLFRIYYILLTRRIIYKRSLHTNNYIPLSGAFNLATKKIIKIDFQKCNIVININCRDQQAWGFKAFLFVLQKKKKEEEVF